MKIAIIEPVGGHGGMNYYDFNLAKGLCRAGIHVVLYTCDETQVPDGLTFSVKTFFKNIWGDSPKAYRALIYLWCLVKSLIHAKKNGAILVHFHLFHYTILEQITIFLSRFFGFKIVVTVHDVVSFSGETNTKFINRILGKADKLIAHNHISKKVLINKMQSTEQDICIIPHGNYIADISLKPNCHHPQKKENLLHLKPVILFFGQIKQVKGLDILLNALPEIIKKFPDLKLVIAGKVWKDDFKVYETIIKEKKLFYNIDCHIRYIPDNEVSSFYYAADIVVLPYRRIYQSGALLMAMSYKKPVIVSDLDGMLEIIQDNINGYVFKTGDIQSLSSKIIYALSNYNRLNKIAVSGFETANKDYDWDIIGKKTAALYKDVLLKD